YRLDIKPPARGERRDHFWMFDRPDWKGASKAHPLVERATEVVHQEIENAIAGSGSKKAFLHFDRPGYSLELAEIPLNTNSPPTCVTLKKLADPAFTIIVSNITGNEGLADKLRGALANEGFNAGSDKDWDEMKNLYKESRMPDLDRYVRLTKLRGC